LGVGQSRTLRTRQLLGLEGSTGCVDLAAPRRCHSVGTHGFSSSFAGWKPRLIQLRKSSHTPLQGVELPRERLDRLRLRARVVPVDVERPLDTRIHEQGNARPRAHLLVSPPEHAGGITHHASGRVGQQVEGVLDPSRALHRARIDRQPQGLGQLAIVEGLTALRQVDGAFKQVAIHIGGDQPFSKFLQRALRKRRYLRPQAPQHHLHPEVDDGQFDHLGVGNAQIPLHEHAMAIIAGGSPSFPAPVVRYIEANSSWKASLNNSCRCTRRNPTASGRDRDASRGTALAGSARPTVSNAQSSSP
jgi:hypothetical protein